MPRTPGSVVQAAESIRRNRRHQVMDDTLREDIVLFFDLLTRVREKIHPNGRIHEFIARELGVSPSSVVKVLGPVQKGHPLARATNRGNRCSHRTSIHNSFKVRSTISKFLQKCHSKRKRIVGEDIKSLLTKKGLAPKTVTLQTVNRFLKRAGYIRCQIKGKPSLHLQRQHLVKRIKYLRERRRFYDENTQFIELFTDESYCHEHHQKEETLVDPSAKNGIEGQRRYKGRRWCFIDVIGRIHRRGAADRFIHLDETFDIFEGKSRKDYHSCFDSVYYKNWIENKLIPVVSKLGEKLPVVLHLDGAPYHLFKSDETKIVLSMKKGDLVSFLQQNSVPFPPNALKLELQQICLNFINQTTEPWIYRQAAELGWTILVTPPKLHDFQPIEWYWAELKDKVAASYTTKRTFDELRTLITAETRKDKRELIEKIVKKAISNVDLQEKVDFDLLDSDLTELPAPVDEQEQSDDASSSGYVSWFL